MEIKEIKENKKDYTELLLLGDEDIDMLNKYLDLSTLFALFDNDILVNVCAVLKIDFETLEIKNLATCKKFQNMGYAPKMLDFIFEKYKPEVKFVILGTGENETTLNFYKKRGFSEFKRISHFFKDNYKKPVMENGKILDDMIYLKKNLHEK